MQKCALFTSPGGEGGIPTALTATYPLPTHYPEWGVGFMGRAEVLSSHVALTFDPLGCTKPLRPPALQSVLRPCAAIRTRCLAILAGASLSSHL